MPLAEVDLPTWDNRNLKLPLLATGCMYWGDICQLICLYETIEIWNCHYWPLDACTGGYLPGDLPIWAVMHVLRGVDLAGDLPIWTLTSILHVKLGKYELSELKSVIVIWGVSGGVEGVLHLTWLYNANWLFTTLIIQK